MGFHIGSEFKVRLYIYDLNPNVRLNSTETTQIFEIEKKNLTKMYFHNSKYIINLDYFGAFFKEG